MSHGRPIRRRRSGGSRAIQGKLADDFGDHADGRQTRRMTGSAARSLGCNYGTSTGRTGLKCQSDKRGASE